MEVYCVYIWDDTEKHLESLCTRVNSRRSVLVSNWKLARALNISKNHEILIVRVPISFSLSFSIRRAADSPLIIRHLDLYPAFFSRPITHNGAICVMLQLGRFRRASAASGHASNTRSPTRDLAWTGSGTCYRSLRGGENRLPPRVSFLPALDLRINPTFSTSSIYLAPSLFHGGLCVHMYAWFFATGRWEK